MSSFVKFTPSIEAIDPDFEKNLDTIIKGAETYVSGSVKSEGTGRAVRDAHAQGYGLVKAEFEILPGLPEPYAQGVYATPGKHDAVIRFSNGSPHTGADVGLGGATGLALKVFDIPGDTLLDDERDTNTFDYANINAPIFFCNTVEHYLFVQTLFIEAPKYVAQGKPGIHKFMREFVTGKGTLSEDEWAWDELLAFLKVASGPTVNLLSSTYWTMGAVRHGDYIAKVSFKPSAESAANVQRRALDLTSAKEVFRPALVAELQERASEFDVQVQLCTDLARMPVEDVTVEWSEAASPPVTVAKLRLPRQDISGADNLERMDALSFSPWRTREAHRPLGNIQRTRKEVYRRVSILRHRLNSQARVEPRSLADIFGA